MKIIEPSLIHDWDKEPCGKEVTVSTKLYKENLESYVKGEGMHISAKKRVVGMISALMAIGFVIMLTKEVYIGCMILFVVWVFHLLYFAYGVKTKTEEL